MGGFRSHIRWNTDAVVAADSASNAERRAEAMELAVASDLAILVLGDNVMTSREAWAEAHLGDRARLDLPGPQEELVEAVVATGTPTVLVLQKPGWFRVCVGPSSTDLECARLEAAGPAHVLGR